MKQYLYIFESGNFRVSDGPNEADLQAVREGFLSVIDMTANMYYDGTNWVEIETFEVEGE